MKRKEAYQIVLCVEVRKVSYILDEDGFVSNVRSEEPLEKETPYDTFGMAFNIPGKTPEEAVDTLSEAIRALLNRNGNRAIARQKRAKRKGTS